MTQFLGWEHVAHQLRASIKASDFLNATQKDSVHAIAERLSHHGVIIADEVGMGKTRIAVELIHAVREAKGRVAIIVPSTLGYQWQQELMARKKELAPKHVLNSLQQFIKAWDGSSSDHQWFQDDVVLFTHSFANWQFQGNARSERWGLVPAMSAAYRETVHGRAPNYSRCCEAIQHENIRQCAYDVVQSILTHGTTSQREGLQRIDADFSWTKEALNGSHFSSRGKYRPLLELSVGLGLGEFDFVIIDEAHKSRGEHSGLNKVMDSIIQHSDKARRLAMTATPVELDASQWKQMLERIQVDNANKQPVLNAVEAYTQSVDKLRSYWKSDELVRAQFIHAAQQFELALKPYVLRRDKRQDTTIKHYHELTQLPLDSYRRCSEVRITNDDLNEQWKKIVFCVEGLSAAAKMKDDSASKRARLTIANGHAIANLVDSVSRDESCDPEEEIVGTTRADWWKSTIMKLMQQNKESMYYHPAINKVVNNIEADIQLGQKVLVFGKYTKPMKVLVNLLNARAMLRALDKGEFWPQAKVHVGDEVDSELDATKVASLQLNLYWSIDEINQKLKTQYDRYSSRLERNKEHLFSRLAPYFSSGDSKMSQSVSALFFAAKRSQSTHLATLTRAVYELSEHGENATDEELAHSFSELIIALCTEQESEQSDGALDLDAAEAIWSVIMARINADFAHIRGGMARLLYGGTLSSSRQLLQLGFNRQSSFPQVLVAQSSVGREGLNLHRSCRIVYLLHPEWNPGVVEQQIGRVDRLGSRWQREFEEYADEVNREEVDIDIIQRDCPRIEIKTVIFSGTYDEYNWDVLLKRWDDLRAQLHGVVIPHGKVEDDFIDIHNTLCESAPDLSPPHAPF